MAAIKHIAFTMYSVTDMGRARDFYEKTLGLELTHDYHGKWIEYHLENGAFAITTMVPTVKPSNEAGGSIAFEVDDIDAYMKKMKDAGVKVAMETFESPVCRLAVVLDPDGNGVTIHQKNPDRL